MVLEIPVAYHDSDLHNKSISVIGSYTWSDIFVEINVHIPTLNSTSRVFVAARVDQGECNVFKVQDIYLYGLQSGVYQLSNDFARTKITQQGSVQIPAGWHILSLLVQGTNALGAFDGVLFNATIPTSPAAGFAAIGTDSYGLDDFDNLVLDSATNGLKIMQKHTMLIK
nr:galactocerebrosidase-like isoform X2 [Biomphalaria glabrata]